MGFSEKNLGNHVPRLMGPKFHASGQSGSEEENFLNTFLCIHVFCG